MQNRPIRVLDHRCTKKYLASKQINDDIELKKRCVSFKDVEHSSSSSSCGTSQNPVIIRRRCNGREDAFLLDVFSPNVGL